MNQPAVRKRIPYGMMNFIDVRESNCYYVDKTHYIPLIEEANKYFFYIRPRRFGKSLTISMLRHYYNILEADKFEKWYGDLYIGKHPTPERNSYLIIYLNFAVVNAELNSYRESLDAHCNTEFNFFCDVYAQYLPEGIKEEMNKKKGAVEQLDYLYKECVKTNQQIYLFIDEYDHFTNKILSEPSCLEDYKSETHGIGYMNNFFNTIKAGTAYSIKRCFITGISPLTMNELLGGFNVITNYSFSSQFNEMIGFTNNEVREILNYYATTCAFHHSTDEIIAAIKPWYDNYCFSLQSHERISLYNSSMVLNFVNNYILNSGNLPQNMIEEELIEEYNVLIKKSKESNHNALILQTLLRQGYITGQLKTGFSTEAFRDPENFICLLFYYGILTINGTQEGETLLTIPNKLALKQLYSHLISSKN